MSNTGRHITDDNFFTNLVLVRSLLSRQLTHNGTTKNKGEIPTEMLPTRQRATFSSVFGFQRDTTLVSYVPKWGKAVILLSSLHHDNECAQNEAQKAPNYFGLQLTKKFGSSCPLLFYETENEQMAI